MRHFTRPRLQIAQYRSGEIRIGRMVPERMIDVRSYLLLPQVSSYLIVSGPGHCDLAILYYTTWEQKVDDFVVLRTVV
jgi:hypothetical protein